MPCLYARINKKPLIILNPTIETGTPQRTLMLNIQWNIVITSTLLRILLLRTATMWSNSPIYSLIRVVQMEREKQKHDFINSHK